MVYNWLLGCGCKNGGAGMKKLKTSHELFCRELIAYGGNATRAYGKIYPKASYESARHGGWRLCTNVDVQKWLIRKMEAQIDIPVVIEQVKRMTKAVKISKIKGDCVCLNDPDNRARVRALSIICRLIRGKSDIAIKKMIKKG